MKTHISKSIFATLCFALVAAAGYFSYQQNQENMLAQEQELFLEANVEALTNDTESNSKDYKCVHQKCSITINLGFFSYSQEGDVEECLAGNSVAHCWNCLKCTALFSN